MECCACCIQSQSGVCDSIRCNSFSRNSSASHSIRIDSSVHVGMSCPSRHTHPLTTRKCRYPRHLGPDVRDAHYAWWIVGVGQMNGNGHSALAVDVEFTLCWAANQWDECTMEDKCVEKELAESHALFGIGTGNPQDESILNHQRLTLPDRIRRSTKVVSCFCSGAHRQDKERRRPWFMSLKLL